jgi:hypothetical protein
MGIWIQVHTTKCISFFQSSLFMSRCNFCFLRIVRLCLLNSRRNCYKLEVNGWNVFDKCKYLVRLPQQSGSHFVFRPLCHELELLASSRSPTQVYHYPNPPFVSQLQKWSMSGVELVVV